MQNWRQIDDQSNYIVVRLRKKRLISTTHGKYYLSPVSQLHGPKNVAHSEPGSFDGARAQRDFIFADFLAFMISETFSLFLSYYLSWILSQLTIQILTNFQLLIELNSDPLRANNLLVSSVECLIKQRILCPNTRQLSFNVINMVGGKQTSTLFRTVWMYKHFILYWVPKLLTRGR